MILYLVRHAEYASRGAGHEDYAANAEASLSAFGKTEAAALARSLSRLRVDKIFYSPFRRAEETARVVGRYMGIPIACVDGLAEQKIVSETQDPRAWKEMRDRMRRDHDLALFGSESVRQAADRLEAALRQIAATQTKVPCVITHALVMQAFLAQNFFANGIPPRLDTASITAIRFVDGRFSLVRVNRRPLSVALFLKKALRWFSVRC
jgi:broad specificity phosphatase PhoE